MSFSGTVSVSQCALIAMEMVFSISEPYALSQEVAQCYSRWTPMTFLCSWPKGCSTNLPSICNWTVVGFWTSTLRAQPTITDAWFPCHLCMLAFSSRMTFTHKYKQLRSLQGWQTAKSTTHHSKIEGIPFSAFILFVTSVVTFFKKKKNQRGSRRTIILDLFQHSCYLSNHSFGFLCHLPMEIPLKMVMLCFWWAQDS